MKLVATLVVFLTFLTASIVTASDNLRIVGRRQASVSSYLVPPANAALDQYAAFLRFSVLTYSVEADQTIEDTQFNLFNGIIEPEYGVGPSEVRDAAVLLITSLHVDVSALIDVPSSTVQLIPFNSTTLRVQVTTNQPQQAHNLLTSGFEFQSKLINATREVFNQLYVVRSENSASNTVMLFAAQLTNFHLFSSLLEVELVDSEGGRGPAWDSTEIKFPTVLRALEADLLSTVYIQASFAGAALVGDYFIPTATEASTAIAALGFNLKAVTATDLAGHLGARRVTVFIKLEAEDETNLSIYSSYLLGRHSLPKTTGELHRQVHPDAEAICVVKRAGATQPPAPVCGAGCYIPAILWCSVLVGIAIVGFVAWGEETPEQKEDDTRVIMEAGVQDYLDHQKKANENSLLVAPMSATINPPTPLSYHQGAPVSSLLSPTPTASGSTAAQRSSTPVLTQPAQQKLSASQPPTTAIETAAVPPPENTTQGHVGTTPLGAHRTQSSPSQQEYLSNQQGMLSAKETLQPQQILSNNPTPQQHPAASSATPRNPVPPTAQPMPVHVGPKSMQQQLQQVKPPGTPRSPAVTTTPRSPAMSSSQNQKRQPTFASPGSPSQYSSVVPMGGQGSMRGSIGKDGTLALNTSAASPPKI